MGTILEPKQEKEGLIKRFRRKTPAKNKQRGIIWTVVAGTLGTILTAGVVTAPLGIILITAGAGLATTMAVVNGQKVEEK